jgi:hypothetical protein
MSSPSPSEDPKRTIQQRMDGWLLRLGTAGQLLGMLSRGGRWWMIPLTGVLLLLGIVLVAVQSVQYVAPFIYLVF